MNRRDRRAAKAGKRTKYVLRSFTDPERSAVLCRHMAGALDDDIDRAAGIGVALKLTKAVAAQCGDVGSIMPTDLTEAEQRQWADDFARFWLWEGDFTCETCGHVARGVLTQSTHEDRARWRYALDPDDETVEDSEARARAAKATLLRAFANGLTKPPPVEAYTDNVVPLRRGKP
jgi:hypothetical protein